MTAEIRLSQCHYCTQLNTHCTLYQLNAYCT